LPPTCDRTSPVASNAPHETAAIPAAAPAESRGDLLRAAHDEGVRVFSLEGESATSPALFRRHEKFVPQRSWNGRGFVPGWSPRLIHGVAPPASGSGVTTGSLQ